MSNPIRCVSGVSSPLQYFLDLTTPHTPMFLALIESHKPGLLVLDKPLVLLVAQRDKCYGAAPTQGQRSLVNDQGGLGAKRRRRGRGCHTGLTEG